MTVAPDSLHRTEKLLVDSGEAATFEEAKVQLAQYVLQIDVGANMANRTRQAIVLTAVNAAARAFRGGVFVRIVEDATVRVGWDAGCPLSQAVEHLGGVVVSQLNSDVPTICVGDTVLPVAGRPILRATFDGWVGGVVEGPSTRLQERDWFIPAGVTAAGIAVGEAFECRRGDLRAGRRSQGLSLWRPDVDWLDADAAGPSDIALGPSRCWVIGLGHLGQAFLWALSLLPYEDRGQVRLMLQDDDRITTANESTGLLTPTAVGLGRPKTRLAAEQMERLGFQVSISERRFQNGHGPSGDEPRLALVGVDNPDLRATLSDAGFDLAIDAGLGAGPLHYRDILTHVFPAGRRSDEIPGWREAASAPPTALLDLAAYRHLTAYDGDECGTVLVAGRSVAAAFVGATAAGLVIAEAVRCLSGEHRYAVIDLSLRDLAETQAIEATDAPPATNLGFSRLT